jgi:hypothetical protein
VLRTVENREEKRHYFFFSVLKKKIINYKEEQFFPKDLFTTNFIQFIYLLLRKRAYELFVLCRFIQIK